MEERERKQELNALTVSRVWGHADPRNFLIFRGSHICQESFIKKSMEMFIEYLVTCVVCQPLG